MGHLRRIDIKFLLKGHMYFVYDRKFETLESFGKRIKTVETLGHGAYSWREANLKKHKYTTWSKKIVKSFEDFLKQEYNNKNRSIIAQKIYVRDFACISFGYGELFKHTMVNWVYPNWILVKHLFIRLSIEIATYASYFWNTSTPSIRNTDSTLKYEREILITGDMKCVTMSRKYLSTDAQSLWKFEPRD